jgi:hypothetical protein
VTKTKSTQKKTRNVVLPLLCNIKQEDIPTFIWYIKANGGDRWC